MGRISKGQVRAELESMLAETGDERFRSAIEAMDAHGLLGRGRGRPRLSEQERLARAKEAEEASIRVMLSEGSTRAVFAAIAREKEEDRVGRKRRAARIKREYYRLPETMRAALSGK